MRVRRLTGGILAARTLGPDWPNIGKSQSEDGTGRGARGIAGGVSDAARRRRRVMSERAASGRPPIRQTRGNRRSAPPSHRRRRAPGDLCCGICNAIQLPKASNCSGLGHARSSTASVAATAGLRILPSGPSRGPCSGGASIHRPPDFRPCTMPLITPRSSTCGLPRVSLGRCGSRRANCASVTCSPLS